MGENRIHDPSKICALEFKREFRRFGVWSVSATIDIDWPIFPLIDSQQPQNRPSRNYRTPERVTRPALVSNVIPARSGECSDCDLLVPRRNQTMVSPGASPAVASRQPNR
jgi:hypothetical protein